MNFLCKSVLHKVQCFHVGSRNIVCKKINQIAKRASMLENMLKDRDKRKNWHFEILQNNAKSKNVFEKVHKPHKRQSVLNSLFIRNISDVLSTGDVSPEVLGHGIEITCVKVSPCCKILNVYWQIPVGKFSDHESIATALNMNAHKIRAELVSRNVMGRVPQIFFIRDTTNAYLAAFEKALEEVEKEIIDDKNPGVVPDDSFYSKKKIFVFKNSKQENQKKILYRQVSLSQILILLRMPM